MERKIVEILQYTLSKGAGAEFHNIMAQISVPLHNQHSITSAKLFAALEEDVRVRINPIPRSPRGIQHQTLILYCPDAPTNTGYTHRIMMRFQICEGLQAQEILED